VVADAIGAPPNVKITPPTSYFTIENKAITMAPDSVNTLQISRRHRQNIVLIKNAIPQNKLYVNQSISVERPALFFVHLFAEILHKKGIKLKGKLKTVQRPDSIDYTQLKLAVRHSSPALQEIIKVMNKPSQNLYAEQLLHTLGAEYGETGNAKDGATVVSQTLARMGISEHEFIMRDGSGLSRHNLVSPSAVAALLRYMSRHKNFDQFYESLSIAGTDGTLRNRMKGSRAENNVRAKTGHVGWVSNLSGYITSLNGEKFIFSILVNNFTIPTKAIHHLQEKICLLVSQYQN
jgi:D-alanyl-D-alanine carboxypeptidase/D-alanyl-D-alanine-endopeptidase (penicillin-binding protein 4)